MDPEPDASAAETIYTVETLARITHLSRDRIVLYYRRGLISGRAPAPQAEPVFDEAALHRLSRIAFFVSAYGLNDEGVHLLTSLIDELDRLREQVRFLRR